MSTTNFGVNSPESVKLWSRKLAHEVRKASYIDKFVGESADSLIQTKNDTKKSAGDRITITLRMLLTVTAWSVIRPSKTTRNRSPPTPTTW